MKTDKYTKLYEEIIKNIDTEKYNNWFLFYRPIKQDYYLLFAGMRIFNKMIAEKYPNEILPPEPEEAIKYYREIL